MTMKKAFRTALASMCVVWALANTRIAFWRIRMAQEYYY
jgi:hypothetical protein